MWHIVASFLLAGVALAGPAGAQDASALRARHEALREQLSRNDFQRPLYLQSIEDSGRLHGDVYATIDEPFDVLSPALRQPEHWCDVLILHLNVKQCRSSRDGGNSLSVSIGRKFEQPVDDAYPVTFTYKLVAANAEYLAVELNADSGPFSTRNYRLALEAVPIDAGHSFIHMSYSYEFGTAARLALQGYLHTLGRNKVGFTIVGRRADGQPAYIGGLRGVLERNAMRYFLAIDAYLDSLRRPPAEQLEHRLRAWFAETERYATQLHEIERDEYLAMKRREVARQTGPN